MNQFRLDIGLTRNSLNLWVLGLQRPYEKILTSHQVQKDAENIWRGAESIIYGSGKELHFKRFTDITTIPGKSSTGIKFNKDDLTFKWKKRTFRCVIPRTSNGYVEKALKSRVVYCELKRMVFNTGYKYYLIVLLEGTPPPNPKVTPGKETMGVDIGTSTIAGVSDTTAILQVLADGIPERYDKDIAKLQRQMDVSKRMANPDLYNEDGTVKKDSKGKFVYTKGYRKKRRKMQTLYRKKSASIKCSHNRLANQMIRDSVFFICEEMNFKALAKRAKLAKRDTPKTIRKGDKTVKAVYKRRKRFGRSVNARAPAMMIAALTRKAGRYGGKLIKVKTSDFKASQYDHSTDSYTKTTLRDRNKIIDGITVQRDLYSAFLLSNPEIVINAKDEIEIRKPNRSRCLAEFGSFVTMQDQLIAEMKAQGISRKSCFGF